jgi:hypothetical protein
VLPRVGALKTRELVLPRVGSLKTRELVLPRVGSLKTRELVLPRVGALKTIGKVSSRILIFVAQSCLWLSLRSSILKNLHLGPQNGLGS